MATQVEAAGSGSVDEIYNTVFAEGWIDLTDDAMNFIFQFGSSIRLVCLEHST